MTTLPEVLAERARTLDSVALAVDGGGELTYRHWEGQSNAVARGLLARGVHIGERIALIFANDGWIDYAVSYLAVLKAGAVAVPLGPRFTASELGAVLAHSGASATVCPADMALAAQAGWRSDPTELAGGQTTDHLGVALDPGALAEIVYTSGTTGTPKGVACSHASVVFDDRVPAGPPPGIKPIFLHAFPVGTNAGQELVRLPLRRPGHMAVAMGSFDPERLGAVVAERAITHLQLVPAMAQLVVASGIAKRHDLSSLRRIILSSAPLPPSLLAQLAETFPGVTVCNAYSLTESGPARTMMVLSGDRQASVGRPVGATEIRIADDAGRGVPPGATGEVCLRRHGAPAREYYHDPEATATTFQNGWVHTGDLGYLDRDGFLYLGDRKKDLIITGGLNVSPSEVEEVLRQHPLVADVAVVGVAHPVLGEDVAAAVVVTGPVDQRVATRQMQAFVRSRLAEHKTPHAIAYLDHLPRNASGKVLKSEVRDLLEAGGARGAREGPTTAAGGTSEKIATIWREVLGLAQVGDDDDFFGVGGHSLAALQVAARLADAFSITVSVEELFDAPTVGELARLVDARRAPAA